MQNLKSCGLRRLDPQIFPAQSLPKEKGSLANPYLGKGHLIIIHRDLTYYEKQESSRREAFKQIFSIICTD